MGDSVSNELSAFIAAMFYLTFDFWSDGWPQTITEATRLRECPGSDIPSRPSVMLCSSKMGKGTGMRTGTRNPTAPGMLSLSPEQDPGR